MRGEGMGLRGLSQWVQLWTRSPNKLWRSDSIFNLCVEHLSHWEELIRDLKKSSYLKNSSSLSSPSSSLFLSSLAHSGSPTSDLKRRSSVLPYCSSEVSFAPCLPSAFLREKKQLRCVGFASERKQYDICDSPVKIKLSPSKKSCENHNHISVKWTFSLRKAMLWIRSRKFLDLPDPDSSLFVRIRIPICVRMHHQGKIVRKTLNSSILWLLYDFL